MFDKVLIANRSEIALRIIRTCKRMGISTVAVFSEVDSRSPYVEEADETVFIGAARAQESFLNQKKILAAALSRKCQAIHPGYGFLSENAEFAKLVADAGLSFIGPPADAIARLGDKVQAKLMAIKADVPVVPGHAEPLGDIESAKQIAGKIGFPILLKPAAGGGGRGMRIVRKKEELASAFSACREEARKGFGDDRLFLERYIDRPRHIEFQIMADSYGNVIHLGERECSVQRRYQKLVEETPSVVLDEALRRRMGDMACLLAKESGFVNAGTVEFILDADKNFYFLEMNTRLQVEHPVTEMVTSLDLVELQLRIAAGEAIPFKQEDVKIKGWAIEARICAEDPFRNFLPTTGIISRYSEPRVRNVRIDSGVTPGSVVTIYYDSLLAKVIAWGKDRNEAIDTLVRGLNGFHIVGLTTNVDFANSVLNHPAFIRGELSTNFIDEHFEKGRSKIPPPTETLHYMAMAAALVFHNRQRLMRDSLKSMSPVVGRTQAPKKEHVYIVRGEKNVFEVKLLKTDEPRHWQIRINRKSYEVTVPDFEFFRRRLKLNIDGKSHMFRLRYQDAHIMTFFRGTVRTVEIYTLREWRLNHYMLRDMKTAAENVLKCPMPGLVTAVCVKKGDAVHRGDEVIRMESMKMESGIAAPCDGLVENILVQPGQAVESDEVLITFKL